jgi:2-polyprenyl-3-methyl-5-hydroxy-6-metoxy-1,4-benzoquinol methylase
LEPSAIDIERRAFKVAPDDWAHVDFTRRLHRRLEQLGGGKLCELGGGAKPAVELDFLGHNGLDCLIVDISASELEKAPSGYATLVGDVSSAEFRAPEHDGNYDFVFSRVVAEHVPDARQFHLNARRLLRPGGIAMHFFPTLWWPPYVLNRVLPEALAERILLRVEPWRKSSGKSGKFPAYYHWCYGPTKGQVKRLATVGFQVEHCVAYFGESSHAPGRALGALNDAWTAAMLRRPSYLFTSYAAYTLRAV